MTGNRSERTNLRLNVGAGLTEWGDVRLDVSPTDTVTLLGDMHALPVASGTVSEPLMDNVLEHTADVTGVLREVHRVLRPGGVAYVYVPYYTAHGAHADPTHRSYFTEDTFEYYTSGSDYEHYADFEFEFVDQEFVYSKLLGPVPSRRLRLKIGHAVGDLVLAMKTVLRKPGGDPVTPTIEGWLET
jgi:SAM-dependent methyltransferase